MSCLSSLLLLFTCSSQVFARVPTHSPHPPSPIRFTDTEKLRELMIGDVSTNLRVSHTPTAHLCARFVRACTLPSSTPPHKSLAVAVVPLAAAQAHYTSITQSLIRVESLSRLLAASPRLLPRLRACFSRA